MKTASVAEIKSQFNEILKASEGGPVVVTRNGRPVAVILGVHDQDEVERLLMGHSTQLQAILDRSRQQFRDGEWLSEEDFWAQFEPAQPSKTPDKPRKPARESTAASGGNRQRASTAKSPRRRKAS